MNHDPGLATIFFLFFVEIELNFTNRTGQKNENPNKKLPKISTSEKNKKISFKILQTLELN